jgi:DNA modification methylase
LVGEGKDSILLKNGDARNLLSYLEGQRIDVTITSPPYHNLKSYDQIAGQIGYGQKFDDYKNDLTRVFADIFKATKDTGSLWLVVDRIRIDGELFLLPSEMAKWLKEIGWILNDVVIWDKMRSHPIIHGGLALRRVYEQILFFSKSRNFKSYIDRIRTYDFSGWWVKWPERYKAAGKVPTDIWSFQIPTQGSWSRWNKTFKDRVHECPFAPDLVERMLLLTTDEGDLVFDPFAGSGMVLAVADCMKRKPIGIEINPTYCNNFWNQVLPVTRTWHTEKSADRLLPQKEIEDRLLKLKKLKYASLVSQQTARELPALKQATTFLLDSKDGSIDVYIVYDDYVSSLDEYVRPEHLAKQLNQLTAQKLLKSFGLAARLHMAGTKDFIKEHGRGLKYRQLYLYKKRYKWESRLTFDEWAKEVQSSTWKREKFTGTRPPIVSSISVFQNDSFLDLRKEPIAADTSH